MKDDNILEIEHWKMEIVLKTIVKKDEDAIRIDDSEVRLDKLEEALEQMDVSGNVKRSILFTLAGLLETYKLDILVMALEVEDDLHS